jgi:hypothetical protein
MPRSVSRSNTASPAAAPKIHSGDGSGVTSVSRASAPRLRSSTAVMIASSYSGSAQVVADGSANAMAPTSPRSHALSTAPTAGASCGPANVSAPRTASPGRAPVARMSSS